MILPTVIPTSFAPDDRRLPLILAAMRGPAVIVRDPDAEAHYADVIVAGGSGEWGESDAQRRTTRNALSDLAKAWKSNGAWPTMSLFGMSAGKTTIAGVLVPFRGPAPTNFNFVNGDQHRLSGLQGKVNAYLNLNFANNTLPQNSRHQWFHTTSNPSQNGIMGSMASVGEGGDSQIIASAINYNVRTGSATLIDFGPYSAVKFFGWSRSSGSGGAYAKDGAAFSFSEVSSAPGSSSWAMFRHSGSINTGIRATGWGGGTAVDLQLIRGPWEEYLASLPS